MRLPRDISGCELASRLSAYGYNITRQIGTSSPDHYPSRRHHITIPNHDPLKAGTLNGIISDVAEHFGVVKDKVARELFK